MKQFEQLTCLFAYILELLKQLHSPLHNCCYNTEDGQQAKPVSDI
jgi:hypothetical protein